MVAVGDRVAVHFDLEYVKMKVASLDRWTYSFAKYLGSEGSIGRIEKVSEIDYAVQVEFPDGVKWWYPVYCVRKVGNISF